MKILKSGYTAEIDTVDKQSWHQIINQFDDANIYQTWSYDEIRCGRKNISHLILKKNETIVAVAQARVLKIPIVNMGVAYVRWGPLWQLRNTEKDIEIFLQAIRALRNEYVYKRGLVLRIFPILFDDESDIYLPLLKQEGFKRLEQGKKNRTLIIDLSSSLEDLRKGLKQKWRNSLNRALKNELDLIEGHDDELFESFISIYRELIERKKFVEPNDINEFRQIQSDLPENMKMRIMMCKYEGQLCTGAIFSAIGNTGLYLFGATNDTGMKSCGSQLIQWKFMEYLKEKQFSCYNLNGINPKTNPGTYQFKAGLCGKNGKDVYFLGQFDAYKNALFGFLIKCAEKARSIYKNKM
ncbi:MAG TPA: peptidoglycan bridge formation glycyltransferase FemA/FemB family protein [Syntrophales bacterium]|nr:peptidoglycan bridge formation glycyltransferase FemA/FemB family protein [Syntrophales bacterium]